MNSIYFCYLQIFWQLIKSDLKLFKTKVKDKAINSMIWATSSVVVMSYIMPAFGLQKNYASFFAMSSVGAVAGFEVFPQLVNFALDLKGNKRINYFLTLPIPNLLLLVKEICMFTINSLFLTLIALICCKLSIWGKLDLSLIHIPKFLIAVLACNIQFACFIIFLSSIIEDIENIENTFMRIVFPLWFFGCFQFSWNSLHQFFPVISYINLLNPYTHCMELLRSASLGNTVVSLPFWSSLAAVICFSGVWVAIGAVLLKKRLDFV